jgi:hypothetical protein
MSTGIGKRVAEAFVKLHSADYEGALIPTSISVDATAKKARTGEGTGAAYKGFLRDNLNLITRVAMGGGGISNLNLGGGYSHPKLHPNADGFFPVEQLLYHVVRCGLLHEGCLPSEIQFVAEARIEGGARLTVPAGFIVGMLAAVVVAPVNAGERVPVDYGFVFPTGRSARVNELWGRPDLVEGVFAVAIISPLWAHAADGEIVKWPALACTLGYVNDP